MAREIRIPIADTIGDEVREKFEMFLRNYAVEYEDPDDISEQRYDICYIFV